MFILPLSRRPDWRNPPFVTLLLILANCMVFFGPQRGDAEIVRQAVAFYAGSSLPQLEFPRYTAYLVATGRAADASLFRARLAAGDGAQALAQLQSDGAFQRELRAGQVLRRGEGDHARWRDDRDAFERILGRQVIERLAFVPSQPVAATLLSHMFLHGSLGHLIGNMLVLGIVGYMVEELLGHLRYLAFYLLGGLAAVGLYWTVHAQETAGLVGASGAIAAVMGLYTVLLGMRRIDFFYSLLFWFDFVRAPAIVLLPLWLGNELYQLATMEGSQVAYTAHIGGLMGGALLGLAARARRVAGVPAGDAGAAGEAAFDAGLAKAEGLVRGLQLDRARQAYAALAAGRPTDRRVLAQYLTLARGQPDGEHYRKAVSLILALTEDDAATVALQAEVFNEYAERVKRLRLPPRRMFELARRFADQGRAGEAQRIAYALARHRPEHPGLPGLLLRVARALAERGDEAGAARCGKLLADLFPDSPEARLSAEAAPRRRS